MPKDEGPRSGTPLRSRAKEAAASPSTLDALKIVLISPRNPLNIGAAARAMSNFGFSEMRLVNPYEVAFKEARSAVKAHRVLEAAKEFETVAEAVADCELVVGTTSLGPRALEHPLRRLEYGGKVIARKLASREKASGGSQVALSQVALSQVALSQVALLFGSEKFGLSNEDMSHCHWLMRIPSREEHGSMNLGQAVAVCLYEIIRNPAAAKTAPEAKRAATAEERERIAARLEEVLARSGYVHARTEGSTRMKIRRLIYRLQLNAHDAEVWMGMLRQILWKLDKE
jgi:TrmH family RNA methyltransferase